MTSRYHVFISHAGEDKHTLATPLYNVLKDRGIKAFLDQPELPGGEDAPNNMVEYMETAPIGVFIMQPEFLAKKWTMKELLCFERRVEEAKTSGDKPPLLIPVFYGMRVDECGDEAIFESLDEKGKNVFSKWGFFRRAGNGETSVKEVLQAVKKLSIHTGVVNSNHANNDETPEMVEKRAALVGRIAEMVEDAVERLCLRNGPGSTRDQTAFHLSGPADSYTPYWFVPPIPSHVILDFETRDSNGNYVTVEGRFKDKLWYAIRCKDDTSAAAVGTVSVDVLGLTGMGGVGKSVSLIALGHERDICDEFKDGIYFILLGEQADVAHVKEQLARVVSNCGGRHIAKQIREARSTETAVDAAASWFKGKKVLFLIDDVWESDSNPLGFFEDLERLASAEGRIALTTRNKDIAEAAGCPVYFSPREAQGTESRGMLFEYAGVKSCTAGNVASDDAVERILAHCAGLPLALGIAGRAISQRTADGDVDWKGAMSWYAGRVGSNADGLVHATLGRYKTTLREAVETSLYIADKWGTNDMTVSRYGTKLVVRDLYHRLSVLRKQARVRRSMLSKLWEVEDMELVAAIVNKLSVLNLLSSGERIGVHDLLLDVCVHEANRKGMIESYHDMLLRAYYCPVDEPSVASMKKCMDNFEMRAWWRVELDGDDYLGENLARHLVASGNAVELRMLLCDSRWTGHRLKAGNILAWESDFAELLKAEVVGNENMVGGGQEELERGLKVIRDTVALSWPFLMQNPNELAFQIFGRLGGVEENVPVVGEYLRSIEQSVRKPWLRPMRRCLRNSGSSLKMEMCLKSSIHAIAIIAKKSRAFVGVGSNVAVIDLERRQVIVELKGHSSSVVCVAITRDGNRVVSGSGDKTLRVWDMQTMSQVGEALEGHSSAVFCVAITRDGNRVVSGSRDKTLRVWDMQTMSQVGEALKGHSSAVSCVAITRDGNRVVSGSRDKTLRVWDMQTMSQVGEALEGHSSAVLCVAITRDGNRVVSGSLDKTLRVWDMQTMSQVGEALKGHSSAVSCVAITRDGNRVVSGSWDKTLRVWDMQTMSQVGEALKGHSSAVRCVAITRDGNRVVSGSWDKTLRVWDMQTMSQVGEALEGHSSTVSCVAITRDGKYIVSVAFSGEAIVWKIETGEAIGEKVAVRNFGLFISSVHISEGNVVTIVKTMDGEVVRRRIDEQSGCVDLPNSDYCLGGSSEEGGGMLQVVCERDTGNVWLQFPDRQLLATFPDSILRFAFDERRKTLAIGHISGAVSFHKLVEWSS